MTNIIALALLVAPLAIWGLGLSVVSARAQARRPISAPDLAE